MDAKIPKNLSLTDGCMHACRYAELKNGDFESAELAAAAVARLRPDPEQLWFIGFSLDLMRRCKALMPTYPALHVLEPRVPVLGMSEDEFVDMVVASARELDGVDPCAMPSSVSTRLAESIRALDTEALATEEDNTETRRRQLLQQLQQAEHEVWEENSVLQQLQKQSQEGGRGRSVRRPKTLACWVWRRFPETDQEDNWRHLVDVVGVDAITTDRPRDYLRFVADNYAEK
jgi:hypothetical protein